ncbi:hypothetical protein X975_11753, partial [Stegodyphus mimosarum]
MQFNPFSDPFCSKLKCGPGCELEQFPSSPNERCPSCVCRGSVGERVKCLAMHCELPCRFERFSQYGCPSCICHPIPCSPLNCQPGYVIKKFPEERCPRCEKEESSTELQCSPVKCDENCYEAVGSNGCETCICDPQCSQPKCDAKCRLEIKPGGGPCPECVC